MKHILSSTAIAAVLAIGSYGLAGAQAVNPTQPGSASGGVQAQANPPGQMGTSQPGTTGQAGQSGQMGTTGQMGQSGQMGTTGGMSSTQGGASGPGMQRSAQPSGSIGGGTAGSGSSLGATGSATGTAGQASGGASQAGQPSAMSEDQVRNALRARGYSDIEGLERDGDTFRVSEAERYGEKVEDLRVDARTGQVRDEKRLSEDQAKNLLRDQGYSDVENVERDGDTITAKAKRNDREVNLRIDARTGMVTQQQASN